jgi:hypothetical protein
MAAFCRAISGTHSPLVTFPVAEKYVAYNEGAGVAASMATNKKYGQYRRLAGRRMERERGSGRKVKTK